MQLQEIAKTLGGNAWIKNGKFRIYFPPPPQPYNHACTTTSDTLKIFLEYESDNPAWELGGAAKLKSFSDNKNFDRAWNLNAEKIANARIYKQIYETLIALPQYAHLANATFKENDTDAVRYRLAWIKKNFLGKEYAFMIDNLARENELKIELKKGDWGKI